MFSEEEIEALVLGSRWVTDRGDDRLRLAARNALAKIASVCPKICAIVSMPPISLLVPVRLSLGTATAMIGG